ncbi:hypothetical protein K456DRAFT_756249 [Colletotrichum gloeosporioides 23]|nr:hypothetical protein K456DRAFT_756249 [Colletotrichum gloeosporioides 23]
MTPCSVAAKRILVLWCMYNVASRTKPPNCLVAVSGAVAADEALPPHGYIKYANTRNTCAAKHPPPGCIHRKFPNSCHHLKFLQNKTIIQQQKPCHSTG